MNILIWNECYISGGADWSLIDLINNWPNKEDTFTICINESHEGFNLIKDKAKNSKIISFKSIMEDNLFNTIQKKKYNFKILKIIFFFIILFKKFISYFFIINSIKFEKMIINNGGYPGSLTAYLASIIVKIFKRKKIFMIVRNYPNVHYKNSLLMQITKNIVNLFIDQVITVSNSLLSSMIKNSGIKSHKLIRIYNGISVNDKFDKQSNVDIIENSVGIIGNLEERKGHLTLFKAWKEVIKEIPNSKLYVITSYSSGDKKSLDENLKELKILNSVEFIPYQKNIENIYRDLKIIVMPSNSHESFGRIAVESMAFSKPIIASNIGGLKEIITHEYDGLLFQKNDYLELSRFILQLFYEKSLYNKLIKNGIKTYVNKFTAMKMSKNYSELINSEK